MNNFLFIITIICSFLINQQISGNRCKGLHTKCNRHLRQHCCPGLECGFDDDHHKLTCQFEQDKDEKERVELWEKKNHYDLEREEEDDDNGDKENQIKP